MGSSWIRSSTASPTGAPFFVCLERGSCLAGKQISGLSSSAGDGVGDGPLAGSSCRPHLTSPEQSLPSPPPPLHGSCSDRSPPERHGHRRPCHPRTRRGRRSRRFIGERSHVPANDIDDAKSTGRGASSRHRNAACDAKGFGPAESRIPRRSGVAGPCRALPEAPRSPATSAAMDRRVRGRRCYGRRGSSCAA